jgi:ATP-dependent helicase/nuclease subunit A
MQDQPQRAISVSFRAVPALLAFVNDVFAGIDKLPHRTDGFRYDERDRFPVEEEVRLKADTTYDALGLIVGGTVKTAADRVADEIVRLIKETSVRDRTTGVRRGPQPADVAILFRSRDSHREFEKALETRGVSTYVYKGLGFFEADEIQDAVALLRYLADPRSNIRAATLLRSRLVRLSDRAVTALAPDISAALLGTNPPPAAAAFGDDDRLVFETLRAALPRWLSWVDRMSPSELLGTILAETAYAHETRGVGQRQARENLKKLRAIVGRFQNRGYATLARVADHLDRLAIGDESNAAIDATDSVSLMTVHAAKGLEFPIVFLVNMGRGTGGVRAPIRVAAGTDGQPSVAIADYQSEADEDTQAREREETKRLLYVAFTRARDRLYLSATVENGTCRTGRGSLGEVLPASLKALMGAASAEGTDRLTWSGPQGRTHELGVRN